MSLTEPFPGATAPSSVADREPDLAGLRARVTGVLHVPSDPDWSSASTAWVLNVVQTPLAVLEVADADDVVAAVRWAAEHGVQVSAQPTGHGTTGPFDQVLLLRTRNLSGIRVDAERRTVSVEAGVKAGELLAALDGTGLTYLAGSNPDPTVVGMTVTGGIGWFGRAYGVGADSLLGVDLVDGRGVLRHVSATEDPELFWAVRGGGGDFGIITRIELELHPAAQVYGGRLLWPADRMREVLHAFRAVTATAPRTLSVWFQAYQFPARPEVPEPLRGGSFAAVAVAHLGSPDEAETLLAPLRAVPGVVLDLMGEVGLGALGTITNEPTVPMPVMETSRLLERLDDQLIEDLVAAIGPGSGSPLPLVQLRHLGGAFADPSTTGGCFGPVPEEYLLFALGVPVDAEVAAAVAGRFDLLDRVTERCASGRTLLAFLGNRPTTAWWSGATRARLVAAKRRSDPEGVIRSNRPVGSA